MRKTLITICLLAFFYRVNSQVTVTAVAPGPRFTLDDLWQVSIVRTNPAVTGAWVNVSITVYDNKLSKIVTSTTAKFQFNNAAITINKAGLRPYQPISVVYAQRGFKNALAKQGGIFPAGDYKVEVACNSVGGGEFTEELGKFVYNINSALIMPIQLISVYNNDTIKDRNPMFNWVPPYPLPEGNLNYQIQLTEIKPNETPVAAIQRNQPLLKSGLQTPNSFFYNVDAPQLIKGKEYAWQVNAYTTRGDFYSGSDTWRFVYDPEDSLIYEPDQYYVMQTKIPTGYITIDSNVLPIKFVENYNVLDSIESMKLFDDQYNLMADETEIPIAYSQGENYSYISFCEDEFPIPNGMYILEISLLNEKQYYIRFKNVSGAGVCAY